MFKGKKILITGGAGFIGSHLTEKLITDNKVVIYDNLHHDSLKFTNIASNANFELIKGNILDFDGLSKAVDNCDIIIHLAAIAGVENVVVSADRTLDVNLMGTYNLLRAINGRSKKLDRFIFFSTSEVYGPFVYKASENGMTTQGVVSEPRWSYAVSKIAGEHWVYAYFRRYGLPAVIIRPFNIYGERQVGEGAIHNFIVKAIADKPLEIYTTGDEVRSWCYIDDFISAVALALESPKSVGEIYNIGNPKAYLTVVELAKLIIKLSKSKSKIIHRRRNYPDVQLRVPSIAKAKKDLGYKPKFDLEKGLKLTIDWYKKELK